MKIRKNNIGYGLLSLALALAFPLNANADEMNLTPVDSLTEKTDNNLINLSDINMEVESPAQNPTNNTQTNPVNNRQAQPVNNSQVLVNTNYKAQTVLKLNTNYISQKGKEVEDKLQVEAHPVEFIAENAGKLSYTFEIKGRNTAEDYTISLFALKDGKVKKIDLDNFMADDKLSLPGQEMAKSTEKIASKDIFGFRIKTQITNQGSVKAIVSLDKDDQPGDYSLYYVVTSKGKTSSGKINAKVEKDQDNKLSLAKADLESGANELDQAKENPLARLPFTKYLLNDTDEEKKLTDYLDLGAIDFNLYKLVGTFVNPNTGEVKQDVIENPSDYPIPKASLLRFDLREKTDTTNLTEESEILASNLEITKDGKAQISIMDLMDKKDKNSTDRVLSPNMEKLIEAEKASLRKLYPNIDQEILEMMSLSQAISKQNSKLKDLIDNGNMAIPPMAQMPNPTQPNNQKAEKKSVLELEKENREIKDLTQEIRDVTSDIYELIQQALLDYELDSLSALEASDPEAAKEEYKRIAQLVKEAEALGTKANQKLIDLDEIILVDNDSDSIVGRQGDKVVLNLGKLTPLTVISDLTKDSPLESERNFSKNLQRKLSEAIKKVQTVTLGEKDDKKVEDKTVDQKEEETKNKDEKNLEENPNKEEKPNKEEDSKKKEETNPKDEVKTQDKDDKASKPDDKADLEKKSDPKSINEIDNKDKDKNTSKAGESKEKENPKEEDKKDKKEDFKPTKKKSSAKVNTPIFIRYLQSLNLRSRLIDNK